MPSLYILCVIPFFIENRFVLLLTSYSLANVSHTPTVFWHFIDFFISWLFLSQTNTTQFVVILKVTHFASIMIVFFAQEIHWFYNACTFVLLITFILFILGGQIYVWRRRACTPSILCCVYHYEPWLCWAYWATRQSQGSFQTSKLSLNDVPPQ